jgi:hypothetical protein
VLLSQFVLPKSVIFADSAMPHLLASPIGPSCSIPTSTAKGGRTTKLTLSSKKEEQEQQSRAKDLRSRERCDDEEETSFMATMISPEQDVPTKRNLSSSVGWGRDDRELAAMQIMLELPHMPPSPAASETAKERYSNAHRKTNGPTLGASSTSCFRPQPRSFVPYLSTRGRGSRAMTQLYPTPSSRSRPLPTTTAPVLRSHAPPFSPHLYCGEEAVPHSSPFITGQRRGMHVSQRGGGRGSIVVTRERRYPRYDTTIPYYYDHCEYYPHHPYHHAPPPSSGLAEPRNLSVRDLQEEVEQDHEQTSFDQDSLMEESQGVEYESTTHQPEEGPVIFKELVSPVDDYHYQHYFPYNSPYTSAYTQHPPYSRYPLRPAALFREARPPQPKAPSRHMPIRGIPASVIQYFPGADSAPPTVGHFSGPQPKKKGLSSHQQQQQQQQPVVVSLERCIPMNGLVPSKFWG